MSNKKIYKGLNKRRKFHFRKFITILLCIILIVGYTYKKIKLDEVFKNVNISNSLYSVVDKLYFWKNPGVEMFNLSSKDIKKSDNTSNKTQEKSDNKSQSNSQANTEVAVVEGIDVYLIQVGSFDNDQKIKDVKSKLEENKIPNSTVEIDKVNKLQAYVSFKESDIRSKLENTKQIFNDAFLTKLEIPVLSLEYTEEYSYIKSISDNLNSLLKSYEKESTYINENRDNLDSTKYKAILSEREDIIDKLENEVNKIDYNELEYFKTNLLSYTSQIRNNISNYGDTIDTSNEYKYESLLISSIQEYYEFINKIKTA
ncbi:MAG: hypothetical protein KH083_03740 [Intestinibacter bartlettii]|uniref:hypothetical protein n=1 Tax=Intestinibacter bartlettii TaxID=261299 RepID=UPI00242C43B2|nr:hypothetical protein [Intestinibacter bartlettii]MBS7147496.1 hypothetical protein [Intestinibacter bartlettii]